MLPHAIQGRLRALFPLGACLLLACCGRGDGCGKNAAGPLEEPHAPRTLAERMQDHFERLRAKESSLRAKREKTLVVKNLAQIKQDRNAKELDERLAAYCDVIEAVKDQTGVDEVTDRAPPDEAVIQIGFEKKSMGALRKSLERARKKIESARRLDRQLARFRGQLETLAENLADRLLEVRNRADEIQETLPLVEHLPVIESIQDGQLRQRADGLLSGADRLLAGVDDELDRLGAKLAAGEALMKKEDVDERSFEAVLQED